MTHMTHEHKSDTVEPRAGFIHFNKTAEDKLELSENTFKIIKPSPELQKIMDLPERVLILIDSPLPYEYTSGDANGTCFFKLFLVLIGFTADRNFRIRSSSPCVEDFTFIPQLRQGRQQSMFLKKTVHTSTSSSTKREVLQI